MKARSIILLVCGLVTLSRVQSQCPATEGQSCAAPDFPGCDCDSLTTCVLPRSGVQPRSGTCKLNPVLLPGGLCFTDRNCDFDDCCVVQPIRPYYPCRKYSKFGSYGCSLYSYRPGPDGECKPRGGPMEACGSSESLDRHEGICPCDRISACSSFGTSGDICLPVP